MIYRVIFKQSVLKDMKRIPAHVRKGVWSVVEELKGDPYVGGAKKIQGYEDLYRIRIGKYRIIYEVAKKICIITVIKVGHRKDVYKDL